MSDLYCTNGMRCNNLKCSAEWQACRHGLARVTPSQTAAQEWINRFDCLQGMGAVICEGQMVNAVCAELDRLRAEVASLKEKESAYYRLLEVEGSDVMVDTLNRIDDLTQQLAAANGRVEMLKAGLVKIADVYEYTNQIPEDMTIAEWMAEQAGAALSNLNEDSAG